MVILLTPSLSLIKRKEKHRYEDGDDDEEDGREVFLWWILREKVDEFYGLMEGTKT